MKTETTENIQQGLPADIPTPAPISSVVSANMQALVEREQAGRAEHGADMDRQDYTAQQWLEELISESLDSANYGRKLLEILPRLEAAENLALLLGYSYRYGAWELPGRNIDSDSETEALRSFALAALPLVRHYEARRCSYISLEHADQADAAIDAMNIWLANGGAA